MKARHVYLLIPLFLLQALTVGAIVGTVFRTVDTAAQTRLWILDFMALADVLVLLVTARKLSRTEAEEAAANPVQLYMAARAQRHDVFNHLFVIRGLLQRSDFDRAITYMDELITDFKEVSDLLTLGKPVVGALIMNKAGQARAQGIDFKLTVRGNLTGLVVKETYLTKILGNILDNGMDAVQMAPEKKIELKISEEKNSYVFQVTDSGDALTPRLRRHIFKPMFSTKGPGRGVGLAIARQLTDMCGGIIEVRLNPTTFSIIFPKIPL